MAGANERIKKVLGDVVPNSETERGNKYIKKIVEIIKRKVNSVKIGSILMLLGIVALIFLSTLSALIVKVFNVDFITFLGVVITSSGIAMLLGFFLIVVGYYIYNKGR